MVARHHQEQLVRGGQNCSERDRRRGVAGGGFEHKLIGVKACTCQLALDLRGMDVVGDDHRRVKSRGVRCPCDRHLQHCGRAGQLQQLLRTLGSRHRPEPCPRPSRKDDRRDLRFHSTPGQRTCGGKKIRRSSIKKTRERYAAGANLSNYYLCIFNVAKGCCLECFQVRWNHLTARKARQT